MTRRQKFWRSAAEAVLNGANKAHAQRVDDGTDRSQICRTQRVHCSPAGDSTRIPRGLGETPGNSWEFCASAAKGLHGLQSLVVCVVAVALEEEPAMATPCIRLSNRPNCIFAPGGAMPQAP